jgi:hypothetical protein
MIKKIVLSFVGVLVLATAAGAVYVYYYPAATQSPAPAVPPAAAPDNSVVAGPVTLITSKSISVKKQDGSTVTLSIASTTKVIGGTIKTGTMVLVNPSPTDPKVAYSIIIVSPPPTQ